jgi:Tol biopolymer transport system component
MPGQQGKAALSRNRALVLGELNAILASAGFARAARRRDILSYLVTAALERPGQIILGSSIATEVYGRELVPDEDAIVRVEMTRLRAGLDAYYRDFGPRPVRISIPKGTYSPVFEFDSEAPSDEPSESAAPLPAYEPLNQPSSEVPVLAVLPAKGRRLYVWAVGAVLLTLAALAIRREMAPRVAEVYGLAWLPGNQRAPSVSPDGKQVAFVWNDEADRSDIYIVPITADTKSSGEAKNAGELRRVTNAATPSMNPVWSPDGRSISFSRWAGSASRAIFVKPVSSPPGRDEHLVTTIHTVVQGMEWTPDGRYLILPDSPPGVPLGLFLVSVTDGARRRLVADSGAYHPSLSPDGKTLAYAADIKARSAICLLPLDRDYAPAGQPRILEATLENNVFFPKFSPDGGSILYLKQANVPMRFRLGSGLAQPETELPAHLSSVREFAPGRYIYAQVRTHYSLARVPEDRGQSRPSSLFQTEDEDSLPQLAPNGETIAFRSSRGGAPGLWVAKPDGTHARKLWDGLFGWLRWSPDSNAVVFSSDSHDRGGRLYRAALSGGAQAISLDGASRNPFYSRDGKWLYYASDRGGRFQLWRSPVGGGAAQQVTRDEALLGEEAEDGQSVFYIARGAVWQRSLADGTASLVLDDSRVLNLRAADGGLYVQTGSARGMTVNFVSLRTGETLKSFTPHKDFAGWYPEHGGNTIVMGLHSSESHLEIRGTR